MNISRPVIYFALASVSLVIPIALNFSDHPDLLTSRSPASVSRRPEHPGITVDSYHHDERIRLSDFQRDRFHLLSNSVAPVQLEVLHFLPGERPLDVRLSCDQPFRVKSGGIPGLRPTITVSDYSVRLRPKHRKVFLLSTRIQNCELTYEQDKDRSKRSVVHLVNETIRFPWLKQDFERHEVCNYQPSTSESAAAQFFFKTRLPQLSCAHEVSNIDTLETPESGFLAKTEALLGYRLPDSFISDQNPDAEIDFSHAPKLDAVFVSTLVYRADFYGTVLGRILKWHAEHGAIVHVVTTQYMMLEKDKVLLHDLEHSNGNFRLQEFKYYDTGNPLGRPFRYVDTKFRDMHIKLFVTLSHDDVTKNVVIFGGRNIHDGFLFRKKPDYSKYPKLVQYGVDEDFVHWNDFEMKVTSRPLAEVAHAHLMRFWNRDAATQQMEDFAVGDGSEKTSGAGALFRHFISLPYNDSHTLESLYVSLIDSSKKTIQISSPYLRPTPAILQAINRALLRNVDVTIQTRISLQGDTQAWLYEEVNKESINRLFNRAKIYEWKGDSILHSKFILVDGEVGFIGSVNLSRRSFVQDVENGFLIRDPALMQRMDHIFQGYIAKSGLITEAQKRRWFPSLLVWILKNQF